jgi:hypothetical protein
LFDDATTFFNSLLEAIERRYPTREVQALVAEIRRLNAIAETAGDLVRALNPAALTTTPKLLLTALVERPGTPATGITKSRPLAVSKSIVPYTESGWPVMRFR